MAEPSQPSEPKTEAPPAAAAASTTTTATSTSTSAAAVPPPSTTTTTKQAPPPAAVDDDSDPDFDDLDDVLDQFSANAPTASTVPPPSRPSGDGAASASAPASTSTVPVPSGPLPSESEDEFLARLTQEMSSVMSAMSTDPAASATSPEDIAKMGRELEEFTQKMEAEGVRPEDLLKAILGEQEGARLAESAEAERDRHEVASQSQSQAQSKKGTAAAGPSSFDSTIRSTMARMSDSSAKAASASQQKSEEDMLTEMLKALESGADGSDSELSKMFLGMMEQLTNKEMLYEPMKELDDKYPAWLEANKAKLPKAEHERYSRQRVIVADIVRKYEEKDFSDEDPKCREYIWEKMQAMQAEGAPPEDLVSNPLGGGGGIPGMPPFGPGGEGLDEGCPTQ